MNSYPYNTSLANLLNQKGGIMLFSIQKPEKLFRGIILLSPVRDNHHRRIVCMREYVKREV